MNVAEQQRHRRQASFTAREQRDVFELLSRRLDQNVDARVQNGVRIGETEFGTTATEQPPEHRMEVFADPVVCFDEELFRLALDLRRHLYQVLPRRPEILQSAPLRNS